MTNDELIRKRDAIYAVEEVGWYHINKNGELVKGANSKDNEPLYKAKDIYEALENVKPVAQCLPNACTDAISRQDAINAPVRMVSEGIEWIPVYHIENLPSAQPKRGKWIDTVIPSDNGGLLVQVCDQCNTFFPLAYTGGGHHFCPNCGAKMER